ncbi:MAG: NAD-dependent epimerase/dehydratase family protein [Fimbriimonadaceae bacterium]|nr:NAD-dependent epimerase/dehydratase family protein [Alphaproteobacteria bacterium]
MDVLTPEIFPDRFADEAQLEDFLMVPSRALIDDLAQLDGDIMVLGVGGKMGPTLAGLAKRAAPDKRIVGVARFSEKGVREKLENWGVETISCDLLDRDAVAKLPKMKNIIFMAGRKFGSTGSEELTWAMNAYVPAIVGENFAGSRIVAFSTSCVYPFVDVYSQGATESVAPSAPSGEYANSCVGRERMFEYFSPKQNSPGRLIRLSYAIDMRYGVLHDVARKVLNGETIDLSMGHVNVIWQGDASAQALRALLHCELPTTPLNVSGPETVSIRSLANIFGGIFDKTPVLTGEEKPTAWLINTGQAQALFGYPLVTLGRLIAWTGDWVQRDMPSLGKATHYEQRDGTY